MMTKRKPRHPGALEDVLKVFRCHFNYILTPLNPPL